MGFFGVCYPLMPVVRAVWVFFLSFFPITNQGNQRSDAAVLSEGTIAAGRSTRNLWLMSLLFNSTEGEEVVKEVEPLASAQDYIEIIKQLKTAQQQVQEEIRLEEEKHQERKRQFEEETKRLRDGMRRISHSTTPSALRTAVENELPPEIINQTPALSAFLTQEQPEPEQAADTDFDNIDWGGSLRIRKVPDMDKEDEPAFKKPLIVEL
eukprot:m.135541 g.135541  ORF g.135541 m.135541 type:complete len:209 (-) comp15849_c2_seq1:106-732(-)